MNKTININLGGFPFTMDDDAYELLEKYMTSIKNHFAQSDSYQEIISDIEIRLGELLQEKITSKSIVTTADIESVIKVMGRPEEFGAESIDLPGEDFNRTDDGQSKSAKTRKLFRDTTDKYLGGVCSGLAAFLGIKNANWIRLAFLIFATSFGFGIPLYIIMWIFVPEAKTSADFLAMKGKKVTVSNIADLMEKEFGNFSNQISDLKDDISQRISGKTKSFREGGPLAEIENTFKSGASKLGRMLRPFGMLIGGILLLFFAFIWITSFVGYIFAIPLLSFVSSSSPIINFLLTINSFVIMIVPLVFIIFWALRLIFNTHVIRSIRQSLLVFWISNLICFIILGATTAREYKNYGSYETKQNIDNLTADVISLNGITADQSQGSFELGDLRLGKDEKLEIGNDVSINIYPAKTQYWTYTKRIKSRGKDAQNAKKNADCIEYSLLTPDDHTLNIPTYFTINKDCKFRLQDVEIDLYIPIGKSVTIADNLEWRLSNITYDQNQMPQGWKFISGRTYKMTPSGLNCADCTADDLANVSNPEEYEYIDQSDIPNNAVLQSTEADQSLSSDIEKIWIVSFDKIMSSGNGAVKFDDIKLNVDISSDNQIHIKRKFKFYGKTPVGSDALNQVFNFRVNNQDITFSNAGYIQKTANMYNPSVEVTLLLPKGSKIQFDDSMNKFAGQVKFDKKFNISGWNFVKGELLEMGADGLKCLNCEE